MRTKNKNDTKSEWIYWIKLIAEILSFLAALIALVANIRTKEQLFFAIVLLGFLAIVLIVVMIFVVLLKKIKPPSPEKFRKWFQIFFNKMKWITAALLFILSFSIFIIPLIFRLNSYTVLDQGLKNNWTVNVLGERCGVSWNVIDLDSLNKALFITFANYQANQEVVLTALGSPLNGVDLNRHFRLKGETIRLWIRARSLNNILTLKVRLGGGNKNSIAFQRFNIIQLNPNTTTEFLLPKNEESAINAQELKHVTIVLGLQPAYATTSAQQILLEKVWFVREGNTLWWKMTIWAALFTIFIFLILRIFRSKETK